MVQKSSGNIQFHAIRGFPISSAGIPPHLPYLIACVQSFFEKAVSSNLSLFAVLLFLFYFLLHIFPFSSNNLSFKRIRYLFSICYGRFPFLQYGCLIYSHFPSVLFQPSRHSVYHSFNCALHFLPSPTFFCLFHCIPFVFITVCSFPHLSLKPCFFKIDKV